MPADVTRADYERAFRSLLWRLQPERLELKVQRSMDRVTARIQAGQSSMIAHQEVYERARSLVIHRLVQARQAKRDPKHASSELQLSRYAAKTRSLLEAYIPLRPPPDDADFHCDSGLGGLARWLRAAGYDARFWRQIDDSELLRRTRNRSAILLTTDRPLMRRSAVTWGAVSALLVPLGLSKHEQFRFVIRRLQLPRRTPRCMTCGGPLIQVPKETVRDRIPPRTYPWLDDYFECRRCGQLFWKGTHWQNVEQQLTEM